MCYFHLVLHCLLKCHYLLCSEYHKFAKVVHKSWYNGMYSEMSTTQIITMVGYHTQLCLLEANKSHATFDILKSLGR
jgi:hypothetical protein